jgi:MoaA/NifB/PqqE/SkfB family radical SAM enzyme
MEAFETNSTQRVDGSLVHRQLKQLKSDSRVQVRVVPDLAEEDTVTYYAGMSPVDGDRCTTPWCGAIVKPNGDVVPCIDYVVGNVTETPFRQIWNSERMRLFRKVVREQRYFPGCTRCCGFFG